MSGATRALKKAQKKQAKADQKAAAKDYKVRHAQHERTVVFSGALLKAQQKRAAKAAKDSSVH